MRIASLSLIAAFAVLPAIAFAQSTGPAVPSEPQAKLDITPEMKARFEKFRAACGADLQTHCKDVPRGDQGRGEMRKCIDTNKVKFSSACQAAIAERDAARKAAADKPKS